MDIFEKNDKRTHYCGTLTTNDIGKRVTVLGWAQKQRDLGALIFIDLRDRSGIIQLAFDEGTEKSIFEKAFGVRAEFVLMAKGVVRERATKNKNIPTGDIEIAVDEFKILNKAQTPPFEITDGGDVKAELRMKHRYLDLRRPEMQKNIIARSKITNLTRN
jgi:aspartyl-tRNA synthetase